MKHYMIRHDISATHPVFGGPDWRKLTDDDELRQGDETQCVSMLLKLDSSAEWDSVVPEWNDCIGFRIGDICDNMGDADGHERMFRRRVDIE